MLKSLSPIKRELEQTERHGDVTLDSKTLPDPLAASCRLNILSRIASFQHGTQKRNHVLAFILFRTDSTVQTCMKNIHWLTGSPTEKKAQLQVLGLEHTSKCRPS